MDRPEEVVQVEAGSNKHMPAWAHRVRRLWKPFLTRAEKARIVAAIAEQEERTTGEIRVDVVTYSGTKKDILVLAKRRFVMQGLHKTPDRNGVLVLISRIDRRFAIWGDDALQSRAGHPLWDRARDVLAEHLAAGRTADGIVACVRELGDELARHFPRTEGGT